MENKILMIFVSVFLMIGMSSVSALDADTPYTVTVNYIVGEDTSFTVTLAGAETTIDFNPATLDSKEVEPDSQVAGTSTPMLTITNAGNVALNFTNLVTVAQPSWVDVSYNNANSVDWTQEVTDSAALVEASVAIAGTVDVYFWGNFTSAVAGTTARTYQINTTAAA